MSCVFVRHFVVIFLGTIVRAGSVCFERQRQKLRGQHGRLFQIHHPGRGGERRGRGQRSWSPNLHLAQKTGGMFVETGLPVLGACFWLCHCSLSQVECGHLGHFLFFVVSKRFSGGLHMPCVANLLLSRVGERDEEGDVWYWHRRTRASGCTLPPLPPV